jgi:hypothetical protein
VQKNGSETTHIFHKNREISFLAMKKKHSKVKHFFKKPQKVPNQERQNKQKTPLKKRNSGMNNSASLTPVQGPSTVVFMIMYL